MIMCVLWQINNNNNLLQFFCILYRVPMQGRYQTVTVTVTETLVLRPLLEDRGRITDSIRILVTTDRMEE